MSDLDRLQKSIGQWGDETFPRHYQTGNPDMRGPVYHLLSEAQELVAAYESGGDVAQECADVTILALTIAHLGFFLLGDAIEAKMVRNRARKWGQPDANGVSEHIREEDGHD